MDILKRMIDSTGPSLAPDLTILFLRADATAQEIGGLVSDRRFAANGVSSRRGMGGIPDQWVYMTSDETVDRARYEESEQWKERIRQTLART